MDDQVIKPRATTVPSRTAEYLPLTTVFTPPPSCINSCHFGVETQPTPPTAFCDFSAIHTVCWPPYYKNLELPPVIGTTLWYSPGVCPASWSIAHSALLQGSEQVTTKAWCCPSGMAYSSQQTGTQEYCSSNVLTPRRIWSNGNWITTSNFYAFHWPISVQWASSDLSKFTPASAPILARTSGSTTKEESSPTGAAGQTGGQTSKSSDSSGGGLSTGAEAGIGVGVGIVGAVLLALAIWLLMRRRRSDRGQSEMSSSHGRANEAASVGRHEMAENRGSPPELREGHRSERWELGSPRGLSELGTKQASHPSELEGRGVHEI